jgi:hypothetical protein
MESHRKLKHLAEANFDRQVGCVSLKITGHLDVDEFKVGSGEQIEFQGRRLPSQA